MRRRDERAFVHARRVCVACVLRYLEKRADPLSLSQSVDAFFFVPMCNECGRCDAASDCSKGIPPLPSRIRGVFVFVFSSGNVERNNFALWGIEGFAVSTKGARSGTATKRAVIKGLVIVTTTSLLKR